MFNMFRRVQFEPLLLAEASSLVVSAPLLYFPNHFPAAGQFVGIVLLTIGWACRKKLLGSWFARTPVNWPLWFWFLVCLPLSVLVAPAALREQYSLPRALILIWNFSLFWFVVGHCGRSDLLRNSFAATFVTLGTFIAVAAIFGTKWMGKFPGLYFILERLPTPLIGVFEGAESGFSPNQLAGTLLYVLPFAAMLLVAELTTHHRARVWLPLACASLAMTLVFVASQSRAGFIGLTVSAVLLLLSPSRWGRWLLAFTAILVLLLLLSLPVPELLARIDSGTRFDAVAGGVNMAGRLEIWQRAVYGIQDFPLTGMGLGTFRKLGPLLYPIFTIPATFDIAHAHNFFLQTGLDFGLPGLVAVLAIYLLCVVQAVLLWSTRPFEGSQYWSLGLLGALLGQAVYSIADTIAMGAKTNLFAWFLFALLVRLGSLGVDGVQANARTAK
jgi:O-antigen ligase